ncbi:DUF4179 domain-containing protein [Paenibacillus sp. DYY-L-2]|uniref:DUF4179 domain-containing protein n=1 Tax=Paenibacillus sp. DYY-L-2 TaxID=3447013 RepID=UPI003F4FCABD
MNRIERQLIEERERLDRVAAPEELEERLRAALSRIPEKRTKRHVPRWTVAAILIILVSSAVGYNYEAFAYYGKKILGFDEVMTSTLKELNDAGMGQTIGEKALLHDGTELIVNGVMGDANQLIVYYTLQNPDGLAEETQQFFRLSKITGFLTDSPAEAGTTLMNEEQTELKGTMTFEPVSPFAKKLTLHYAEELDNRVIENEITFSYHPGEAIRTQIKQSIKRKVAVDKGAITFDSVTATPISTVIKGTWNVENMDRFRLPFDGIELIANGAPVDSTGSGFSTDLHGRKFELHYDALPEPLDSLQLVVKEFAGYERLDEKVELAPAPTGPVTLAAEKKLWIKNVKTAGQTVELTIATGSDVLLDGVSLQTGKGIVPLQTTVGQTESEGEDGSVLKVRTLLFDTSETPEQLLIEGMHYMKSYDYTLDIPVD